MMRERALIGCLLGTAVGDAMGLPYEGMTASRGKAMFPDTGRHHFLFGRGMVSDDTEHTCFTAQALIKAHAGTRSPGSPSPLPLPQGERRQGAGSDSTAYADVDPDRLEKELASSLRWWLLGLPAGVGFATLRSIVRLWLGVPPAKSGVFSAGNGPAMRSPIIGAAFGASPERLRELVFRSTRMTHSDPKAFHGAMVAAVATHHSARGMTILPADFAIAVRSTLSDPSAAELLTLIERACRSAEQGGSVTTFANTIGSKNGISGYIYHTVPCVIQAWLRHQRDYAGGIREIIEAGGDTDTTAAILGGIIGAGVGRAGIPDQWLRGIAEWPRNIAWMEKLGTELARSLAGDGRARAPRYFVPGIVPRNLLFTSAALAHGLRRLLPPYK